MRWYFDYISPYAYLQSTQLTQLASQRQLSCTPVLFAGLLKHWGNLGPAEIVPKRKWTFRDVAWLAHRDNIELNWPPQHPFNPLPLLRLGIVHNNSIEVVQRLFRFVWVEGNIPQDDKAFEKLLQELGTTHEELQTDNVKRQLQENGDHAIKEGVFGVPTIQIDDELFWGYNATDMARSYLTDNQYPHASIASADSLPQGPRRQIASGTPVEKLLRQLKDAGTEKSETIIDASEKAQLLAYLHQSQGVEQNTSGASKVTITRNRRKEVASTQQSSIAKQNEGPRIPLQPIDLAEPADLVAAIRKRRGGELIELDRLLLYSTPLSEGWNHFVGNIRQHFSVPQVLREIAMCTVAVLNEAEYEYSQHAPLYIKAGGSDEKALLIRQPDQAMNNPAFTESEQLAIALTTQLTRDVKIDDDLFTKAATHFGYEHLVELIATIAAYNMVSRFLVAFELHP